MAQVRTRKRGKTWSFIFEAGIVNGKRKVVEKGGYPTKDAAYKAGIEKYTDFIHGNIGITSEAITLKDFMTNWLENVVSLNVKETTLQTYQSLFNNHILPFLGEVKVQELTPAMLDDWLRSRSKTGLSRNTLRNSHDLIKHALDYAVHPAQLIKSNSAIYIKVPKNAPKNIVKRTIITPEQFKALLEKYPFGTPFYIPLLLLYNTGMRLGEVLGLSWDDVDFKAKTITVDKQLTYLDSKGYFFSMSKTVSSVRIITADDFLIEQLCRWRLQQAQNELVFGDSYVYFYSDKSNRMSRQSKGLGVIADSVKKELVCIRDDGRAILPHNIVNFLKEEGLNALSFRHTHATLLIENGAKPAVVSERLGHKDLACTQNIYVHNTPKMQEKLTEIVNKIFQLTYRQ